MLSARENREWRHYVDIHGIRKASDLSVHALHLVVVQVTHSPGVI
jgi:hypothetical protein